MIKKTISDIEELIDNLEYLKTFLGKIPDEKELDVYRNVSIIHTDIQILSGKLKHN